MQNKYVCRKQRKKPKSDTDVRVRTWFGRLTRPSSYLNIRFLAISFCFLRTYYVNGPLTPVFKKLGWKSQEKTKTDIIS